MFIYIYNLYKEYYPTIKENEILSFAATWRDLEGITEKDKCCMISLVCGI